MTFVLVVSWGIAAIVGVIVLFDWLAVRKDRNSGSRAS